MLPPRSILRCYHPALDRLRWHRAAGGFSGANVWRAEDDAGTPLFALKQWPAGVPASRVAEIHRSMTRAARLPFVPHILPTAEHRTLIAEAGRVWDVNRWMPGEARESPSAAEVEAACAAVARLHAAWRETSRGPCPGVLNRLRILREWLGRPTLPAPPHTLPAELRELLRRAGETVAPAGSVAVRALEPWEAIQLPLQTCIRDLRGEHVLFRDGRVTGLVDFGAVATDYPGVDLARLLGDLAGRDAGHFRLGLSSYRAAGGTLDEPDSFIQLLDQTGVVCSVIGWLVRLHQAECPLTNPVAIRERIENLLGRMGRFEFT